MSAQTNLTRKTKSSFVLNSIVGGCFCNRPSFMKEGNVLEQSIVSAASEHVVNQVKYNVVSQFKTQNECAEDLADKVKRLIVNSLEKLENM